MAAVLVYRTGQLGDTIVSLPAIRAIEAAFPDHRLVLLTDRHPGAPLVSSWDILGPTALFDDVLFYTPARGRLTGWTALVPVARAVRRLRPSAMFYFRDERWPHTARDRWFFETVCGVPRCFGAEADRRVTPRERRRTEVDRLLGIVAAACGTAPAPAVFDLPVREADRRDVDALWAAERIAGAAPVVALAPASKMPAKQWPLNFYIDVVRWVLASYPGARVVALGGPGDVAAGEQVRAAAGPRVVNAAGRLSVLATAEALRRTDVYVGNDTGVMHLAAASGVPCVAIFSSRDNPGRWAPYGSGHTVLRSDPSCAGCMLQVCTVERMRCLTVIEPSQVIEALTRTLRTRCAGSAMRAGA